MTDEDKNLLELAARAAGFPAGWVIQDWNPLQDDGDALRLAVKLKLPLKFINKQTTKSTPTNEYGIELWVDCGSYWDSSHSLFFPFSEKCKDDPFAATRRAIVRAAADVGKVMK